ncbi:MAG: hypothetical protein OEQ47_13450, partial [Acidimicrobiia bacterium]|nr:hypothetical protein [Acidimicrobiia bacterium]
MTAHAAVRLPGVTFESFPAPVGDALPRMDIAAFVGFAASGPLDTPVVVEDVARFRDIFGADVSLGQMPDNAEVQSGHLGPTVEAFFRNGGKRCWIVRVAGAASANRFPLDGWIGMDPATGEWHLRQAIARSEGTWSDALRIGTALDAAPISAPIDHDWAGRTLVFASDVDLQAGDMVRLSFGTGDIRALLAVSAVNRQAGRLTVDWQEALVLQRPSSTTPPPNPLRAAVVTADGEESVAHLPGLATRGEPGELRLTLPEDSAPPPQTVLRIDLDDASTLVVRAGDVVGASTIDSPPAGTADLRLLEVSGHDGWLVSSDLSLLEDPSLGAPVAERLAMAVLAWQGERLLG